jgi:hypothetical protein
MSELRCPHGYLLEFEGLAPCQSCRAEVAEAEVNEWKAEYIEARKSGYQEGLEEQSERVSKLEEALKRYAGKRLHVVEGRCRLTYHDGEDSPGMWFHEGETWLLGDEAEAALKARIDFIPRIAESSQETKE